MRERRQRAGRWSEEKGKGQWKKSREKALKKQRENKGNRALMGFKVGKGLACVEESREAGGGAGVLGDGELTGHQNYLESLCLAAGYWVYHVVPVSASGPFIIWTTSSVRTQLCKAGDLR